MSNETKISNKSTISLKQESFIDLVSKIRDIASMNPAIRLKIDAENILMYSLITNNNISKTTLGLKSFTLRTSDYIKDIGEDVKYDLTIQEGVKFVKQLAFIDHELPIKVDMIHKLTDKGISHVRSLTITNKKSKIMQVGAEMHTMKDIPLEVLNRMLDPELCFWSFEIGGNDLSEIKKRSTIYSETSVMTLDAKNGAITITEPGKWEVDICELDQKINQSITFNKKYLSNINMNESVLRFSVFQNYLLVTDSLSKLMLSFEQDFE